MLKSKHALFPVLLLMTLALPAFSEGVLPTIGVPRTLKEIVKNRALAIMSMSQREIITLKTGRLSLMQEMLSAPEQLGKDLPRLAQIKIGTKVIPSSMRGNKSAEQQFMLIGTMLGQYLQQQRPEMVKDDLPGRIGAFWITELIYGVVQNFSGPAFALAHRTPVLQSCEWAAPAQCARQTAVFILESMKEPILRVTFTSERPISNVNDNRQADKLLVTESSLYFHLNSGDVTFGFKYLLDGRGSMRVHDIMPTATEEPAHVCLNPSFKSEDAACKEAPTANFS